MSENEVWKTINIANDYEISSNGRVRNKITNKFLKPCFQSTGNKLKIVYFRANGKNIGKNLGYLIAEHFIPNTKKYKFIRYRNFDFYNDRASNIEWTELRQYHNKPSLINKDGRTCLRCNTFKDWGSFYPVRSRMG